MGTEALLVMNAGSSSIKFSIFSNTETLDLIYHGEMVDVLDSPNFRIFDPYRRLIIEESIKVLGYKSCFDVFFKWLENNLSTLTVKAVGHRIVHGGRIFQKPLKIDDEVINKLSPLIPLAPLHLPHNLEAIKIIRDQLPNMLQVACFDTAFHHTQSPLAKLFAIPRRFSEQGIIRYGFHGLSYEYIASVLPAYLGETAEGKIIVCHLGAGASLCAMEKRKSVATTMSLTPLDGLMMATRCGNIDPGALLYFIQEKNLSGKELSNLLYNESGLLGVSEISDDMELLIKSQDPRAKEAVDLYCYRAACEITSLCTSLNGCDAIVFTAGVGENSSLVRKRICERLQWLELQMDERANENHENIISSQESKIKIAVIKTNEEYVIAKHIRSILC